MTLEVERVSAPLSMPPSAHSLKWRVYAAQMQAVDGAVGRARAVRRNLYPRFDGHLAVLAAANEGTEWFERAYHAAYEREASARGRP